MGSTVTYHGVNVTNAEIGMVHVARSLTPGGSHRTKTTVTATGLVSIPDSLAALGLPSAGDLAADREVIEQRLREPHRRFELLFHGAPLYNVAPAERPEDGPTPSLDALAVIGGRDLKVTLSVEFSQEGTIRGVLKDFEQKIA